jgi:hypothetical protein
MRRESYEKDFEIGLIVGQFAAVFIFAQHTKINSTIRCRGLVRLLNVFAGVPESDCERNLSQGERSIWSGLHNSAGLLKLKDSFSDGRGRPSST